MMVIDALVGNDDRFPGGNLHIRSRYCTHEVGDDGTAVDFGDTRLFSLDNGATFRGSGPSHAMMDLKRYVTRFDRDMVRRLEDLREILAGEGELPEELNFLDFRTQRAGIPAKDFLLRNIDEVLDHVRRCAGHKQCGAQAFFSDAE
jgi:hypothetical protein